MLKTIQLTLVVVTKEIRGRKRVVLQSRSLHITVDRRKVQRLSADNTTVLLGRARLATDDNSLDIVLGAHGDGEETAGRCAAAVIQDRNVVELEGLSRGRGEIVRNAIVTNSSEQS